MESIAKQFVEYLEDNGIGTVGENLFAGTTPPMVQKTNSDDIICVRETGGLDADIYTPFFEPTLQIMVSNVEYDQAEAKIKAIHDLVHAKMHFYLQAGGYYVNIIRVTGHWTHLGLNTNNNHEFSMNLIVNIKRDDLDNY